MRLSLLTPYYSTVRRLPNKWPENASAVSEVIRRTNIRSGMDGSLGAGSLSIQPFEVSRTGSVQLWVFDGRGGSAQRNRGSRERGCRTGQGGKGTRSRVAEMP